MRAARKGVALQVRRPGSCRSSRRGRSRSACVANGRLGHEARASSGRAGGAARELGNRLRTRSATGAVERGPGPQVRRGLPAHANHPAGHDDDRVALRRRHLLNVGSRPLPQTTRAPTRPVVATAVERAADRPPPRRGVALREHPPGVLRRSAPPRRLARRPGARGRDPGRLPRRAPRAGESLVERVDGGERGQRPRRRVRRGRRRAGPPRRGDRGAPLHGGDASERGERPAVGRRRRGGRRGRDVGGGPPRARRPRTRSCRSRRRWWACGSRRRPVRPASSR